MSTLEIIVLFFGSGFFLAIIGLFYKIGAFETKLEMRLNTIDEKLMSLDRRMDKLEEKMTDIDRRLCRLEGAFSSKDCCMLADERQIKKTEGLTRT